MRKISHDEQGRLTQAYETVGELDITFHQAGHINHEVPSHIDATQWQDMVENPSRYIVTTTSGKLTIDKVEENTHGSESNPA